jgi:hypothetical protein
MLCRWFIPRYQIGEYPTPMTNFASCWSPRLWGRTGCSFTIWCLKTNTRPYCRLISRCAICEMFVRSHEKGNLFLLHAVGLRRERFQVETQSFGVPVGTGALQPWGFLCNPMIKMTMIIFFCRFPSNGAPVEWNLQSKTEELGGKTCPNATLSTIKIPHGLTRDRTRASAVGGRRLTAWATARPHVGSYCCRLSWRSLGWGYAAYVKLRIADLRQEASLLSSI